MLKGITSLCLALALTPCVYAQNAAPKDASAPAKTAAAQPADAAIAEMSRAVMNGDQVIRILDETVDWYRMLGVQQQSSTQPSDLLILYANRQTADRVVALAFELARANAELLSSQAELQQEVETDAAGSPKVLEREEREL